MSSPNYHEVLALARELNENERIKLILDISKTMNDVLRNYKSYSNKFKNSLSLAP